MGPCVTTCCRRAVRGAPVSSTAVLGMKFLREAVRYGTDPNEYEIKVFGGGDMFPTVAKAGRLAIGKQNIVAGIELLALHGQPIKARHVGGEGHRVVMFDLWDGNVWVKHQPQVTAR